MTPHALDRWLARRWSALVAVAGGFVIFAAVEGLAWLLR